MQSLEPDRRQIEVFTDALFRHARSGFVSLRAFRDDADGAPPFKALAVDMKGGLAFLNDCAEDWARRAAQHPLPVVFCPPIATFNSKDRAREQDVMLGLALSVECDQQPAQARQVLEQVLGPATVVVASGGTFINGSGPEPKLHLHWRLAAPADTREKLARLKQARDAATRLGAADPSNKTIVHPIRWPGSWHRKNEPVMCRIVAVNADVEIDLSTVLRLLSTSARSTDIRSAGDRSFDAIYGADVAARTATILTGDNLHDSINRLIMDKLISGTAPDGGRDRAAGAHAQLTGAARCALALAL